VLFLIYASQANAQATRTFVSGVGDDSNPCSRTAPCETFSGAFSETATGGEINALDAGEFGTLTITKAITIDVSNVEAGVLNENGANGIVVDAPANAAVVLRGLDIYGSRTGAVAPCVQGGLNGIRVLNAGSVRIEDTNIGSQTRGIQIVPMLPTKVLLNRVEITDICTGGIVSAPSGAGKADLAIRDSTISYSGTALSVADNSTAWLSGSMLSGNALGLERLGTGVINDFGNNQLVGNTVDGTATNNLAPVSPAGPAGAQGVAGKSGVAGVAGPAGEPAIKLLLATSSSRRTVLAGSAVVVRFVATAAASSTLTISRAGKTLRRLRFASRAGSNAIRWNGRIGNARSSAGKYRLTLRAVGADGQIANKAVAVTVKRGR
jgi:hypothetical protein